MISLSDVLKFAEIERMPVEKRRGIVREYLQTLILYYLQKTKFGHKTIFIGGTALRFFYDLQRFSEDLDFNYEGSVNESDLKELTDLLKKELQADNIEIQVNIRKSKETYFHWKVYLQFPGILQVYGCKAHAQEKLSIQMDFQNLGRKKYPIEKRIISKFGKRFLFRTTDLDMFLAEKSNAMLFRDPPRGRDFFDFMSIVFAGAKVNLLYLKSREITAKNKDDYSRIVINRTRKMDFKALTKQMEPFLFKSEDIEIMRDFDKHIDEILKTIK